MTNNQDSLFYSFLHKLYSVERITEFKSLVIVDDDWYDIFHTIQILTVILNHLKSTNRFLRSIFLIKKSTYDLLIYQNNFNIKDIYRE